LFDLDQVLSQGCAAGKRHCKTARLIQLQKKITVLNYTAESTVKHSVNCR